MDKRFARRGAYRISEYSLLVIALIGGSIGAWAGMYCFRHKTKHALFVVGIPLILAVQISVALWLYLG
jgi:uncharacterized membrane protein YsdA (DUF1294 family)